MRAVIAALALPALAGCVTFSEDGGFGAVNTAVRERTGQEPKWMRTEEDSSSVRARVKELLAQPLSAEAARCALPAPRGRISPCCSICAMNSRARFPSSASTAPISAIRSAGGCPDAKSRHTAPARSRRLK